MFQILFSFSGRLNRTRYALASAFEVLLIILVISATQGMPDGFFATVPAGPAIAPRINLVAMLGLAIAIMPSSALVVKRLRDIGLPPWPSLSVILIVECLVAVALPQSPINAFGSGPFAGIIFNIAITILLALVPGRGAAANGLADDATSDWVERAVLAEARLVEDRRAQSVPTGASALLRQADALETRRRQGEPAWTGSERRATTSAPSAGFGRRRYD